jgi:hypothetical protein
VKATGALSRVKFSKRGVLSRKLRVMPEFHIRLRVIEIARYEATFRLMTRLAHFNEGSRYKPGIASMGMGADTGWFKVLARTFFSDIRHELVTGDCSYSAVNLWLGRRRSTEIIEKISNCSR